MFKRLLIAIVLLGLIVGGIVWFKFFRDDMIAQFRTRLSLSFKYEG